MPADKHESGAYQPDDPTQVASARRRQSDRAGRLRQIERWLIERGWRTVRRAVVLVAGGTVLLIGILMIVLPGPAIVVIPLGLAILAAEFRWARRLLREARSLLSPESDQRLSPKERWRRLIGRCKQLLKAHPPDPDHTPSAKS